MAVTPNMSMIIPTVSVTLGPTYATQVNSAFDLVDAHDHTSGKGTRIPTAGLNINTDLTFGGYSATTLKTTSYQSQGGALGVGTTNAVYSVGGDLYWNNGAGTAVKITNGAGINTAALTTTVWTAYQTSTDYTILAADSYGYIAVNSSIGARLITLPAANAVTAGRFYWVSDVSGNAGTNNITVAAAGADTIDAGSNVAVTANYGTVCVVSDGTSKWRAVSRLASTTQPGDIQLAGDLAGVPKAPTVAKVNGSVVPSGGALTTGNVLQVLTPSGLTYGPVNLAGGANYVTGVLPSANMFQATTGTSGAVQLATDLAGSAAAPWVVQISGPGGGAGLVPIIAGALRFDKAVATPVFGQSDRTTAGSGQNLIIYGQSSFSSGTGGDVRVIPGLQTGGGTNTDGSFRVYNSTTLVPLLKAGGVTGTANIHCVTIGGDTTNTNVPDILYDRVLFLHNIPGSRPDTGVTSPSGGAAIYAHGGMICIRGDDGGNPVDFTVRKSDLGPSAGGTAVPGTYSGTTLRVRIGATDFKLLLYPV